MAFLGVCALSFLLVILWLRNRLLFEASKVFVAIFTFGLLAAIVLGYTFSETTILVILSGVSAFCFPFLLFGSQNKGEESLAESTHTDASSVSTIRLLSLVIIVLLAVFGPLKFIWERLDIIYTLNPVLMRIYEVEGSDFSVFLSAVLFFLCSTLIYVRVRFWIWLLIPLLLSSVPGVFDFAKSALLLYVAVTIFSLFRLDARSTRVKVIVFLVGIAIFSLLSVFIQMQLGKGSGLSVGDYVRDLIITYSVKPVVGLDLVTKYPDFLNTNNELIGAQSLWIVHRILGPILSYDVPRVVLPFIWVKDGWLNIFTTWGVVYSELGLLGVLAYGLFNGVIISLLLSGMRRNSHSLYSLMNAYIIVNIVMAVGNPVFSWLSFWLGVIVIKTVDVILKLAQRKNHANDFAVSSV
jgi:oligosaccharide repeat unit polymerase